MGKKGPLSGEQKIRLIKGESPAPGTNPPRPPEHLTERAKKEWNRLSLILWARGHLTACDLNTYEMYCTSWGRYLDAIQVLDEHGETFTAPNGEIKSRPEVNTAAKLQQELRQFAGLFGLAPSARMRMEERKDEDPADAAMMALINGT